MPFLLGTLSALKEVDFLPPQESTTLGWLYPPSLLDKVDPFTRCYGYISLVISLELSIATQTQVLQR